MPFIIEIPGWGVIESGPSFIQYCFDMKRNSTEPFDRLVMNALFTYQPSLYQSATDPTSVINPLVHKMGSMQALKCLDGLFDWLNRNWPMVELESTGVDCLMCGRVIWQGEQWTEVDGHACHWKCTTS